MSTQFCKIGKIKPNFNKLINTKELEQIIAYFVDDSSKVEYSSTGNELS